MSQFISRLIDMLKNDRTLTGGEVRRAVSGVMHVINNHKHSNDWSIFRHLFGELISCGNPVSHEQVHELLSAEADIPTPTEGLFFNTGTPAAQFVVPVALFNNSFSMADYLKTVDLNHYLNSLIPGPTDPGSLKSAILHTPPLHKIAIMLAAQLTKLAGANQCRHARDRYDHIFKALIPENAQATSEGAAEDPNAQYPYSISRCLDYCHTRHTLNAWMVPVELVDTDHFTRLGYVEVVHRGMMSIIGHLQVGDSSRVPAVKRAVHYLTKTFSVNSIASEAFSEVPVLDLNDVTFHIPDQAGFLTLNTCFRSMIRQISDDNLKKLGGSVLQQISNILDTGTPNGHSILFDMVKAHACIIMFLMELIQFDDRMRHALTSVIIMHFEAVTKFVDKNQPDSTKQVQSPKDPLPSTSPNDAAIEWISKYAKEFSTSVHSVTFADGTTRTFQQRGFDKQLDFVQAELAWGKKHIT